MSFSRTPAEVFTGLHQKMKRHLRLFCRQGDAEELHRLRVSIKKIYALFYVIHLQDNTFDTDRYYRAYRKVFKQGGRIRTPQVNLRHLQQHAAGGGTALTDALEQIAQQRTKHFQDHCTTYRQRLKTAFKKTGKRLQSLRSNTITTGLQKLEKQVYRETCLISLHKDVHQLRKLLKILLYNAAAQTGEHSTRDTRLLRAARQLDGLIGSWHDNRVLIDLLKESAAQQPGCSTALHRLSAREEQLLMQIEEGITGIKGELRKRRAA